MPPAKRTKAKEAGIIATLLAAMTVLPNLGREGWDTVMSRSSTENTRKLQNDVTEIKTDVNELRTKFARMELNVESIQGFVNGLRLSKAQLN